MIVASPITNSIDKILRFNLFLFPVFVILGNAAINISLALVSIIYFIECFYKKKILYSKSYEFKYFLLFYLYLQINSIFSLDSDISFARTIPYLKFFIFVLVYKNFIEQNKIKLKVLGYSWIIIILSLALDIIYQSINVHNILNFTTEYPTRNSGFFLDELIAGGFLVAFSYLVFFLIFGKKKTYLFFLYFIFFLLIIFLTGERANLLDYIIILVITFYFVIDSNLISKSISPIVLVLIFLLMIKSFDNLKNRYFSSISFSENKNISLINKYFTSEYGAHTISSFYILSDYTFFGVGNKNFRKYCNNYKSKVKETQDQIYKNHPVISNYASGCATHPHQIYNEFLSEHGIIGTLIIFFIFFKLIFKKFFLNKKSILNYVALMYILTIFIPILPSGSFFSTIVSTFFWINYLFYSIKLKSDD